MENSPDSGVGVDYRRQSRWKIIQNVVTKLSVLRRFGVKARIQPISLSRPHTISLQNYQHPTVSERSLGNAQARPSARTFSVNATGDKSRRLNNHSNNQRSLATKANLNLWMVVFNVYSYAMTCYKILAGEVPLLGLVAITGLTGEVQFVWLVGIGGIGMTALCKTVFNRDAKSLAPSGDLYIGPQMPESLFGVKLSILPEDEPARKRVRTRNWTADEIRTFLKLKEQALGVITGSLRVDCWDYVSENLYEHGFDRSANSCKSMWGALRRSYMAVRHGESKIRAFTEFDLECREVIERILTAKASKGTRCIQMNSGIPFSGLLLIAIFHSKVSDMGHFGDDLMYDESNDSEMEDIRSEDDGLSVDSTATIESQAEVTANRYVSGIAEPYYEMNSDYAGRKRSAATVMEDNLIAMITPFVNKQIEDALKPLLSVLRSREEEEQTHREKMLAMEEQKLALKRQRMQFTHRVLANSIAFRPSRPQFHHEP